jgi:hypothetical protein
LSAPRDYQRSRVYQWESRIVVPRDPTTIAFPAAQGMVNAIWSDLGLRYPPVVQAQSRRARKTIASANRLSLLLPEKTPAWCLLHEIAHAMTTTVDGQSDGHGAVFIGIYVQLLTRYLRMDETALMQSLQEASIRVALDAHPVFVTA